MADEERIFQLLAQIATDQAELRRDVNSINTKMTLMEHGVSTMQKGYESIRADVTRVQLDTEKVRHTQQELVGHVNALRGSVGNLENNVMHELGVLNENLPDALARREAFEEVEAKVDDHDGRIYALEQKASNG